MRESQRQTSLRWSFVWGGAALILLGLLLFALAFREVNALDRLFGGFLWACLGWGSVALAALESAAVFVAQRHPGARAGADLSGTWGLGFGVWLVGWCLLALGIRREASSPVAPSPAAGAKLHPSLGAFKDFHWGTLAAYGGGVLLAELALIWVHTALAAGVGSERGTDAQALVQMPPAAAFAVALLVSFAVVFLAGYIGAAHARRLAAPEATLGLIYFGLPIPVLLTLMQFVPGLQLSVGYRLREILYVAELIGRPEIAYWLVFLGLVLVMVLGITTGFVASGSGRTDFGAGFELFVARRHVSVFRPSLLFGALVVLLLGIIPPLLVFAILRAAEASVERTRIRELGLADPLVATGALNELRLREQSPTAMMTALSVGGVGVGVMALIIVLSVMSGFEVDLQQKILGTNAHAIVLKYTPGFSEYPEVMEKIRKVRGVVGLTPFVMNEVMISSDQNIQGVMIKGVDPKTVGDVTDLPRNILPGGSLDYLADPEALLELRESLKKARPGLLAHPPREGRDGEVEDDPILQRAPEEETREVLLPGIVVGKELQSALKVSVGDRVNIVSPLGGELGPNGPMPKSRPFRVAGIFYSGMYEYDSKFVYIRLDEAESFFNQKGATGIELKVADVDDARRITKAVLAAIGGYPYRTKDWGEMNRNLFSALRLEKLVMGIILSIIVVVAAGLIVATVIMLVLEKRKEIAVLKALGVSDGGVVKIFLAEGLQIGVAGGLLGLVSGLAWCLFIEKVGIKLDPEVYYIPSLPVKIEPLQTAIPVVIAVLVTYLASIYPALKASRVEPVEGLKAE